MTRGRLEAFSDGVLAIVITIMVLELVPPHEADLEALFALWPKFLAYVMSFAYIGIYWINHHHLLHTVPKVTARVLWTNMHLLFWLSLVPFTTAWMGENAFAPIPTAVYGASLIMPAIAFSLLVAAIVRIPGQDPVVVQEIAGNWKGKLSILIYVIGIPTALFAPLLAVAIFIGVAALWIVPDRRYERIVAG